MTTMDFDFDQAVRTIWALAVIAALLVTALLMAGCEPERPEQPEPKVTITIGGGSGHSGQ